MDNPPTVTCYHQHEAYSGSFVRCRMNCTSSVRDLKRCDGNGNFCLPQGMRICDSRGTALDAFSVNDNNKCDFHLDTI